MATDYTKLLLEEMEGFQARLIEAMIQDDRKATGSTIASLHVDGEPGVARLWGAGHFVQLQRGRGPTESGAPPGTPTLLQQIKDWIAAKGLTLNPFAVTKKIHKEGTALYRGQDRRWAGQESGTLAKVINQQSIGDLRARLATAAKQNLTSEIITIFND